MARSRSLKASSLTVLLQAMATPDNTLIQSASDSIQAHERLYHQMKSKLRDKSEAQEGELNLLLL